MSEKWAEFFVNQRFLRGREGVLRSVPFFALESSPQPEFGANSGHLGGTSVMLRSGD